ncbi:glycosyltransferase [Pseudomarimonas arenosa]|uniref:Glycosyltransferase n=1 Tax=Pseudomarimonas arenosa TaxID=2774145 RepID=A0AAW3ZJT9_9GAMM|nr:glycosyltransferase [Pseudomarimonas arenosa]
MAALRVLQLLPALESGGVEKSTLEIAEALAEHGCASFVASAGGRLVEPLLATGSTHIALDIGRKSPWTLRHIVSLRRLIEQLQPDIVHARSRLPAWIAWWALNGLRGRRPHFITTVHGLNSPGHYSAIMTRGERVICVSDTVREYLQKHYPAIDSSRLITIPRGVDSNAFPFGYVADEGWKQAFFAEFPQLLGGPMMCLPGRGTRLKGHADAIELLARLHAAGCDARLLLLGADEHGRSAYLEELREQARRLGVAEALAISAPRHDIREVMSISRLVLQLSNKPEAFGRTVVEALSLGRPVLGFDHGGVGESLRRYFPQGAVPIEQPSHLAVRAIEMMRFPPKLSPIEAPSKQAMQLATLQLYQTLCCPFLPESGG